MRKYYFLLLITLAALASVSKAQPGDGSRRERIESMKVGYLTQKLDLTPEEAQKFWPVYNKYSDELEKSRKIFRGKLLEEIKDIDQMSDAESEKAINDMLNYKNTELELLKKYTLEFKKILPPQKVVKLFVAEQEFKRELLKKLKEQRGR